MCFMLFPFLTRYLRLMLLNVILSLKVCKSSQKVFSNICIHLHFFLNYDCTLRWFYNFVDSTFGVYEFNLCPILSANCLISSALDTW